MKLKCPECKAPLNEKMVCSHQHPYYFDEDVLILMEPNFKTKLESWLTNFEQFRAKQLIKLDFDQLPDSGIKIDQNTWKARKEDVSIISSLIDVDCKKALDVGSWNGWLANVLTKKGLKVTAIDYFTNELDGMKAKKFYDQPNWNSIQMDLEDLSVLDEQFDLIVLNRCFPYFTDTLKLISSLKELLTERGKIVITGINFEQQKAKVSDEFEKVQAEFKETYHQEFLFKPFKGYVDKGDLDILTSNGFKVHLYSDFKNLIKARLIKKGNVSYFAVFQK